MLSVLVAESSCPSSSPGGGHCIQCVFDRMLYSHGASLHPHVQMGTGQLNAGVTLWCKRGAGGGGESRNTPGHFMLQKPG